MKTPEEWLLHLRCDKNICTDNLNIRLSADIIRMIQEDALESQWTPLPTGLVHIQKTPDGTFVVAVDEVWIPGFFESFDAASQATRVSDERLEVLQEHANRRAGGTGGIITLQDLLFGPLEHETA